MPKKTETLKDLLERAYDHRDRLRESLRFEQSRCRVIADILCPDGSGNHEERMEAAREFVKEAAEDRKRAEAMEKVLNVVEWTDMGYGKFCPVCEHGKAYGHAHDCIVAAALKAAKP